MSGPGSARVLALAAAVLSLGPVDQLPRDRAAAPEATGTAVVAGRVLIDVNSTAQPVRRARVTLEAAGLTRTTDSDTDGRYRFVDLPPGSYRVRPAKAGFVPVVRDARRVFDLPAPVEIATGQKAQHDLWMTRGAALEGRVMIDTGSPGIDIVVSALRFAYDESGRRAVPVAVARTDDRGRFRVHTLPAGEYYLEAAPDPLRASGIPIPGRRPTLLSRSYFPSAPAIEGGRTLALTAGQEIGGLDFTLSTMPAVVVSGRVVPSTGGPFVSLPRVQRVGGPVGEVRGTGSPDGGDFQYPNVPPGEYWLMGVARLVKDGAMEFGVMRISVAGQDLTGITIPTATGAHVNGRVEIDGGATLPMDRLEVIAHQTEFELPGVVNSPTNWSAPVSVAADGTFSLKDVFGPRLIRVANLPPGWALKQTLLDGADTTDASFDFRSAARPHELRVVITSRTSRVTGVVRDASGQPLAGARVVVFSRETQTWKFRSRKIRAAETGADGRYVIEGLLDGDYHVVAAPYLEPGSWMDASVLRQLESIAMPVQAANAAQLTVNLVVKP